MSVQIGMRCRCNEDGYNRLVVLSLPLVVPLPVIEISYTPPGQLLLGGVGGDTLIPIMTISLFPPGTGVSIFNGEITHLPRAFRGGCRADGGVTEVLVLITCYCSQPVGIDTARVPMGDVLARALILNGTSQNSNGCVL